MKKGIVFNEDCNYFLYQCHRLYGEHVPDGKAEEYIDSFVPGSNITDFVINFGTNVCAQYPSKVANWFGDKYLQKEEEGEAVDYTNTFCATAYDLYERRNIDVIAIWIERIRAAGVTPWLSMRMNDCHDASAKTNVGLTDFHHAHTDYRRITHRGFKQHFDYCFNYAIPEVRKIALDLLREAAFRYDADGMELDWQREAFCFKPGEEYKGADIITEFVRDVRSMLDEAEAKWGHKIKLMCRVTPDPRRSFEMGFDVARWAREGLVDAICASARYEALCPDIPVELWRSILAASPKPVELFAGMTNHMRPYPKAKSGHLPSMEFWNGFTAAHLTTGADKIYIFNYMKNLTGSQSDYHGLATLEPQPPAEERLANYHHLMKSFGDDEMSVNSTRIHPVAYDDIGPDWYVSGLHATTDLPYRTYMSNLMPRFFRVRCGTIPPKAKVELRMALSSDNLEIYVNCKPVTFTRVEENFDTRYSELPVYVYEIENDGNLPPFMVVEIAGQGENVAVNYIDVVVYGTV